MWMDEGRKGEGREGDGDFTLMSLMEATCAALLTVHPLLSSMVRGVWFRRNVSSLVNGEEKKRTKTATGNIH
jgi:hypothetical protein